MHVGHGTFFQALDTTRSDADVWRAELGLAAQAEPLGFDSVWTVEHHFSEYSMSPHPLQFLSWVAGQTTKVRLGSMVCVLPWHQPVRLAEEVAVLDHLSGGRLILGIGRGLGRIEFDGFGVDMSRSRELFVDTAAALLDAFDSGTIDGTPLRPAPLLPLRGRVYASSISPESTDAMARLGVGVMLFLQKPWEQTVGDLEVYVNRYRELNGAEPPKPLLMLIVACGRDEDEAAARVEHVREYYRSTINHYGFDEPGLAEVPGYAYYGRIAETIAKHGKDRFASFLADLQPTGTPEQVVEQITEFVGRIDAGGVVLVPSFGAMSEAEAQANQALIAERVVPALQALDVGGDIGQVARVQAPGYP